LIIRSLYSPNFWHFSFSRLKLTTKGICRSKDRNTVSEYDSYLKERFCKTNSHLHRVCDERWMCIINIKNRCLIPSSSSSSYKMCPVYFIQCICSPATLTYNFRVQHFGGRPDDLEMFGFPFSAIFASRFSSNAF